MAQLEEFQRAPSAKVTSQMERFSKESLKTAILKQEATFREQVHELHRLYGVQKQLMSNAKNTTPQNPERSSCQPHGTFDPELPQESDLELTLATGCRRTRSREHASYKSDSGTSSISWSSSVSGGSKLIGRGRGLLLRAPDLRSRVSNESISFDLEDENREGRIQPPPWVLPCLSLRMSG